MQGSSPAQMGAGWCKLDGIPMAPEMLPKTFERLIMPAGLLPIRFRNTRHTFATLMLELGESPKTVQTMLGHSRVAITLDIYSHVSLELEKKAAAKLNAAFTGAV
jgi:integrase